MSIGWNRILQEITPARLPLLGILGPLCLSWIACGCSAGWAQSTADERPTSGFSESIAVQWVGVPVELPSTLWGAQLDAEAFVLLVDGEAIPIHDFEGPVAEVALVYVQDLSGSMGLAGKLAQSAQIFDALLDALAPEDQLGVMTFSDRSTEVTVALDRPTDEHARQPATWRGWGKTAIRDALLQAPRFAREARRARTGIVLVTDGNDNASAVSTEELASVLAASAVPLYLFDLSDITDVLAIPAEGASTASPSPGQVEGDVESEAMSPAMSRMSLRELAVATGGASYRLSEHLTAQKAAASLIHRLGRQYWLTFPADASTPNTAHSIQVALRTPGSERAYRRNGQTNVVLHHRSHYLGGEPLLEP